VDLAKADILNSVAAKVEEINQKINEGVAFEDLIATYAVKADGTATDPGMTNEPTKTSGYEVAKESVNYVPEFVEAAFSVDNIGDVSAPYLSTYGVHIVKYIGDVAAGPVAMTDEQRQAKLAQMLEERKTDAFAAKLDEWVAASTITYTGVIKTFEELEAASAAEAEETEEMSVEGVEPEATEVPEVTVAP
jgi:parvulin-like peptidyl-prolyl isomerase